MHTHMDRVQNLVRKDDGDEFIIFSDKDRYDCGLHNL